MSDKNMELWDSVCETDPANTKKVTQRGGFTSICAMSQIREATRKFGPVGTGWGWKADMHYEAGVCVARVELWYMDDETPEQRFLGPVFGCATLSKDGRIDEDAPKKAVTDGLTKSLSYLGFNADVFLGLYDDNKYVAEMKQKHAVPLKDEEANAAWEKTVNQFGVRRVTAAWKGLYPDGTYNIEAVRTVYKALLEEQPKEQV